MYNIFEAHIEYRHQKLHRVTVLVKISQGDVRAIYATDTFVNGYEYLKPDESVTNELLQRVAAYGRTSVDRDKIFKGWKTKYRGL